jgi:hypothetical protein
MACEICGRCSCTRCFHSLEEQDEFDNKTGRYSPNLKFKIHFARCDYEDAFIIEGSSVEEIQTKTNQELTKRGISEENGYHFWSEEI